MSRTSPTLACGVTIDELAAYLGRGRTPRDSRIESCPECLNALTAMQEHADLSLRLVRDEAEGLAPPSDEWLTNLLDTIALEVRAGREMPLGHPDPRAAVRITEGAVRALIRSVGGRVPGVVVGETRLDGAVEQAGAPVRVRITMSIGWGTPAMTAAADLRQAVLDALARHTELTVAGVDVDVVDVHAPAERRTDD